MKAFYSSLLAGAGLVAASVDYSQKVLGPSQESKMEQTMEKLQNAAQLLTKHSNDETLRMSAQYASGEEISLWTKILEMDPDALNPERILSEPKKSTRRPDSFWDHILHGEDVSKLTVSNDAGHDVPEISGDISSYSLRTKAVDPSALGIDKVKQYSGYLDDNDNDKHLFYWFFESRNDPKKDPVILWLNGGPGCSSMTGLFMELGPSMVKKGVEMVHNPHSWNNNASVIFLDQPVNTGFSYSGSSVSNTVAAGKDVYALLSLFFKQFPQYASQDFHIAGESYAGHYIPVFASEILSHKNRNINLKSLLIGNGLTDPLAQYPHYEPMACGKGGWPAVLPESECSKMDEALPRCLSLIESCYNSESVWTCVPASIYCNNAMIGPYQKTGQNVYDIRGKCEADSSLCYNEIGWIGEYLNRKEVQDALGVEVSKFDGCNFDVNRNFLFQGDWMKPYHRVVPQLLQELPVLIYAGVTDFICNWLGNRAWSDELEWAHKKEFNEAETKDLRLGDNTKYGSVKSADNLAFIRLYAAGHMVPYDQPEASLDMLNRWIGGEWSGSS